MSKQYISTSLASQAHESDIVDVVMTNKYTVTVSSDGRAAFWDNKQDEAHSPRDFVVYKEIEPIGIHHVAAFEDTPAGLTTRVVLLAFACFDGSIMHYTYTNDDLETFAPLNTKNTFKNDFWYPAFYKDPDSLLHYFVATKANGTTGIFNLTVVSGDNGAVVTEISAQIASLSYSATTTSFPNTLSVSQSLDGLCAVGYISGDVVVYSIRDQKQIFAFHSTDLLMKQGKGSTSIPRALAFSPGGSLLVVARDNQSAGSITLYDVKHGENVGSLTTLSHSTKATIGGFAHEGWIMGLSFNEDGTLLASCGFDKCIRVWNLELREREATISVSITDLDDTTQDEADASVCSAVSFIKKGVRGGAGGDANEGLCVVSFDRGIRWYREAGGI